MGVSFWVNLCKRFATTRLAFKLVTACEETIGNHAWNFGIAWKCYKQVDIIGKCVSNYI
jgi:hypothetical protein